MLREGTLARRDRAEASTTPGSLSKRASRAAVSALAVSVAAAYANSGDTNHALEWLETAYSEHLPFLVTANSDFIFDRIRSEPRFQALMKKVGWTNTV